MKSALIAKQFDIDGRLFDIQSMTAGNVNDTYLAIYRTVFSETRAVIQRINTYVFKNPAELMENIRFVTAHVHQVYENEQDEADRIWQLPKVIPTRDGKDFFVDDEGNYWRAITQIASAHAYDKIQSAEHAHEVGAVLGKFHHAISDMSCDGLHDTLPGFHITPGYFPKLDDALKTKEGQTRLNATKVAHNVLIFLEKRREWCSVIEDAKARGELSMRPVHGDPKTANVMIDDMTNKGTAIIPGHGEAGAGPHGHRGLPAVVLQSGGGGDARHLVGDVRHGPGGRGAVGIQGAGEGIFDGGGEGVSVRRGAADRVRAGAAVLRGLHRGGCVL